MGQKNATFRCSQWNDSQSKWVSTILTLQSNGQLVSFNRKTRRFIAGVQLSMAYPLLAFGPLCSKIKWTPPLPSGRVDCNLLGIPTGPDAFQDTHRVCWFYFEDPKILVALLEGCLIVLDKLKVPLPSGDISRSKRKRRDLTKPNDSSVVAGLGLAASGSNFDLTQWYTDGLAGAWNIGTVRIDDPRCFSSKQAEADAAVAAAAMACAYAALDTNVCLQMMSDCHWGSNCDSSWDTTGACAVLDAAGTFSTVDSFDFSAASYDADYQGAWAGFDAGALGDCGAAALAAAHACGAHAAACGGAAGCGGGGCGAGGCSGGM